uniref:Pentatricopeptide repeat-containing protein n=1 Tax=Kalanchoe fedtschenkoi TaxID=63787 RepID=A0A7N0ZY09_KALFE
MEGQLLSLLNASLPINYLKQLHALIVTNYATLAPILLKRLILQSFPDYARRVFDQIPQREQKFCYSYMISAYSKCNMTRETLDTFTLAHSKGAQNMCFSVPPVLKCCVLESAVELGKEVHSLVIRCGFDFSSYVQSSLIDFYAKSVDMGSARRIFDELEVKDPVCCNCLISGYSKSGQVLAARKLFDEMGGRTIASWNSMLSCYLHNGDYDEGLNVFREMLAEGFKFDETTLVTVLSTCAKVGNLEMGLRAKQLIDDNNLRLNVIVTTAILEMFVKCGAVDEARNEFDRMGNSRDVVAWSAMIAGYAQNGRPNEALDLFDKMESVGMEPNDVTVVSILSACAQLGSVEFGERIGSFVESRGFASNVQVTSALLDMYSKCGNIKKARQLFDNMNKKDIVTWNSMIRGSAFNGLAEDVIGLYEQMKTAGVKPDDVTFVGLFTACTHAGLVDLGLQFFRKMKLDYHMMPKIEHYACIVDLLCKSGRLDEAYELISNMDIQPNVVIWGTLLSASRTHSNLDLAEISAKKLLELEPENSGNYVLLANIYITMGKWQEASNMRSMMRNKSLQKTAAYSWIELENEVHKFLVGDKCHPLSSELCSIIDNLAMQSALFSHDLGTEMDI